MTTGDTIPELDLTDAAVIRDPFAAYGRARERAPLARLRTPGMPPMWVITRYDDAKAMLSDPRFAIRSDSFMRPDVPGDCLPYMRTMSEMNGPEHQRLRRLVSPAFTRRRAAEFRPRLEPLAGRLLDALPGHAGDGTVDLLRHFARPLPMDVICELVGIPESDRARWRAYGATVVGGGGAGFAAAVPGIMAGAKAAIARRRESLGAAPRTGPRTGPDGPRGAARADGSGGAGGDLLDDLIRIRDEDGDRLTDTEMVTLVWHLVLAGQTPTNLIANAVAALHSHPDQLALLRAEPALMAGAVEELTRWCGPALLSIPRYAREPVELLGSRVNPGEPVTVAVSAVNRDPRVFDDPERLDIARRIGGPAAEPSTSTPGHLGFAHGPHFCLGASLARVQTEVALTALLRRYPGMVPAVAPEEVRAPDPGTWRLTSLPMTLGARSGPS